MFVNQLANTYGNLGIVYDAKGEYDKTIEFYMKAMKIKEKTLGNEHPSVNYFYYFKFSDFLV